MLPSSETLPLEFVKRRTSLFRSTKSPSQVVLPGLPSQGKAALPYDRPEEIHTKPLRRSTYAHAMSTTSPRFSTSCKVAALPETDSLPNI